MKKIRKTAIVILAVLVSLQTIVTFAGEIRTVQSTKLQSCITQEDTGPTEETPSEEGADPEEEPDQPKEYSTGIYLVEDQYRYYEDGEFKEATGIAERISDGKWLYVEDGIFTKKSGVAKRISDGKEMFVENGIFKKVTGVVSRISDGKSVYVKNGLFKKVTGVAKRFSDKKWVYVQKGKFKKATGAAKRLTDGRLVYVKKGLFNKKTGLVRKISNKEWTYVKNGVFVSDHFKIKMTAEDEKAGRQEILAKVYCKVLFNNITNNKMSKKQKLRACFDYVADNTHYINIMTRIPYYNGNDWPVVYINDMIRDRGSTCHGYASLFGYLAKLCGYKNVVMCNQSNNKHAWCEIDGLVYDPIFMIPPRNTRIFGDTYERALSYGLGPEYDTWDDPYNPWMRVRVPSF